MAYYWWLIKCLWPRRLLLFKPVNTWPRSLGFHKNKLTPDRLKCHLWKKWWLQESNQGPHINEAAVKTSWPLRPTNSHELQESGQTRFSRPTLKHCFSSSSGWKGFKRPRHFPGQIISSFSGLRHDFVRSRQNDRTSRLRFVPFLNLMSFSFFSSSLFLRTENVIKVWRKPLPWLGSVTPGH